MVVLKQVEIDPHKGAGKMAFGMTREQIEHAVGTPPRRRARRSAFDRSEIDFFDGFSVSYDERDLSFAIEFHREGGLHVEYLGFDLFAHSASEARDWARGLDQQLVEKDGFVSTALGLSMYAPSIDEPDLDEDEQAEPAQTFLIFRPGYYEEEFERLKRR